MKHGVVRDENIKQSNVKFKERICKVKDFMKLDIGTNLQSALKLQKFSIFSFIKLTHAKPLCRPTLSMMSIK